MSERLLNIVVLSIFRYIRTFVKTENYFHFSNLIIVLQMHFYF